VVATYVTAGAALLAAVIGFVNRRSIKQVHVLVNSNLTKVMEKLGIEQNRTSQLTDTLKDADVPVPPRE
jgi:hypothetical protein